MCSLGRTQVESELWTSLRCPLYRLILVRQLGKREKKYKGIYHVVKLRQVKSWLIRVATIWIKIETDHCQTQPGLKLGRVTRQFVPVETDYEVATKLINWFDPLLVGQTH